MRGREARATAFWVVMLLAVGGGWIWYAYGRSETGNPGGGPSAPGAPVPRPSGPPAGAQEVTVDFPLDGDSLQVTAERAGAVVDTAGTAQLRLLGIDAPEVHGAADGGPQCWAEAARDALHRLAPTGTPLYVLPDAQRRDPYDRHLVYAWTADGRFVNAELARLGAVRELSIRPNVAHRREIGDAVAQARAGRLGLWGACTGT